MNRNECFMKAALKEAQKAALEGEVPIGCVIVKDDKIIIEDMALTEEFAKLYNQSNLPVLKTAKTRLRPLLKLRAETAVLADLTPLKTIICLSKIILRGFKLWKRKISIKT